MQATSEGIKKKAREIRSRITDKPRHMREAAAYAARLDAFRQTLDPEQRALFDHERKLDALETEIAHEQYYRLGMVKGTITALFLHQLDTEDGHIRLLVLRLLWQRAVRRGQRRRQAHDLARWHQLDGEGSNS
jgi:hypothetical protein